MSASELEDIFATQLDAVGLDGYVREYQAIPGRRFRFDFCWVKERLAVEIQGGTYSRGAHARPLGIKRDYEKGNLAIKYGWRVLQFDEDMVKSGQALDFTEKMLRGDNG